LAAALRAQAERAPVRTRVLADGVARYPEQLESLLYVCALEALQNAAKHARPSTVTIRPAASAEHLTASVEDDGCGFDIDRVARGAGLQNLADRLHAAGGRLELTSSPGRGALVTAIVPLGASAGADQ